jgi:hypothetical protein
VLSPSGDQDHVLHPPHKRGRAAIREPPECAAARVRRLIGDVARWRLVPLREAVATKASD